MLGRGSRYDFLLFYCSDFSRSLQLLPTQFTVLSCCKCELSINVTYSVFSERIFMNCFIDPYRAISQRCVCVGMWTITVELHNLCIWYTGSHWTRSKIIGQSSRSLEENFLVPENSSHLCCVYCSFCRIAD